ncbi:TIGR02588 family protein [Rivularia sp. UHCC 0363]|uniref:TIGR02588 family protein n=1 Tax=Rivularia sp. UHCC 0363 TaxID=3110244 RepID=UPI002B20E782|nr:TIGR02588 family protein [Rivularia sp. UHCC 0363]MEA5597469.1 TIGR02588 family protein [Rivularia sp. UHCC 0363]
MAISALIVAVLVGLVLLSWITQSREPPILSVQAETMRVSGGQFYIPFTVENIGGGTAESVQVVGELRQANGDQSGDQILESGEQQIDFLASHEQQSGAFIFKQNPQTGRLSLRVASYRLP